MNRREFAQIGLGALPVTMLGSGNTAVASQQILKKAIPSSGELLPVIGLGTNRYGVDDSDAARAPLRAALQRFQQLGGELIDTAPQYRTSEVADSASGNA